MRVVVRSLALALTALLSGLLSGSTTLAGSNEPDDGTFERELDSVEEERPGTDGDEDGGGSDDDPDEPVKIACRWTPTPATEDSVRTLNSVFDVLETAFDAIPFTNGDVFDIDYYSIDRTLQRWGEASGRFERREEADCTGATMLTAEEAAGYRWRAVVPPEAAIIIPDLTLIVSGRIQLPEPAISPPTEAPVNLGLWLAVVDDGPVVAEGSLGPLWARGTARLTSTTFDPGNGSGPIDCTGAGTPIVDPDTIEQGPCGYTYRTIDDVNAADLEITITTTWTITWETSDGSSDGEAPTEMTRTVTIPYDVYEIQTVGTG